MDASAVAGPVESSDEVYRIYGSVMHTVQYWELALTLRAWRVLLPEAEQREAESQAAAEAVDQLERAFQKVTAGQARKRLEDALPPEVFAQVASLVQDRNRLVHRFLREQQDGSGFRAETLRWLGEAGQRFDESVHLLFEEGVEDAYAGPVRDFWPEVADVLVDRLFSGEPLDYTIELRRARRSDSGSSPTGYTP